MDDWKVALVNGNTQSQKTWKTFELITRVFQSATGNVCAIFITQANSVSSVAQLISRLRGDQGVTAHVPSSNIQRVTDMSNDVCGHRIMVDFWNAKQMKRVIEYIEKCANIQSLCLVIDECDQGGKVGTFARIDFIQRLEQALPSHVDMRLCLVTATIANLSKSICYAALESNTSTTSVLMQTLLWSDTVLHVTVPVAKQYIGPSWFKENAAQWIPLPKPPKTIAKDDQGENKTKKNKSNTTDHQAVLHALHNVPNDKRELCLYVTSTEKEAHTKTANMLLNAGVFNVIVILNSDSGNMRNYTVKYVSQANDGKLRKWAIPYQSIETLADQGHFKSAGLKTRHDIVLPAVLQASLFMGLEGEAGSAVQQRIMHNTVRQGSYDELSRLSQWICKTRPGDYPTCPRVALVAGHIAGRGMTLQHPKYDFLCTSYVFIDTQDSAQRGASNAQRFGRACGMFGDVYERNPERKPILIATPKILEAALCNELAIENKANETRISLASLVTKLEWDVFTKEIKRRIEAMEDTLSPDSEHAKERVTKQKMYQRILDLIAQSEKRAMRLKDIKKAAPDIAHVLETQNRRPLTELATQGRLVNRNGWWHILEST